MRHLFYLLFIPILTYAQEHIPVYPSLSGDTLITELQNSYTATVVLDYSMARDTLFKNIDAKNDTLYGIYTQHGVFLPPDEDPTEAAFKNGAADGINTEHAWPRSKGASEGNAESDMHHLYPSRTPVNSNRANLPFGEVPDPQTQIWYYKNQSQSSIPSNKIDQYSELGPSAFEPRESVKGDIARSMFYFYTIYRTQALEEDPTFFEIQREDLCAWHLSDPVDQTEWQRTMSIASYQDGKRNPFILDCTLAKRTYCSEFNDCQPVQSNEAEFSALDFELFPNPTKNWIVIRINGTVTNKKGNLIIRDIWGRPLLSEKVNAMDQAQINISHLPAGFYIVSWKSISGHTYLLNRKLIIQH